MHLVYDQSWKNKFGANSVNEARKLVNLVQGIFDWTSLKARISIGVHTVTEWKSVGMTKMDAGTL